MAKLMEVGEYRAEGTGHVFLFDMLAYGDTTLCHLPLDERQSYLNKLVGGPVHQVKSARLSDSSKLAERLSAM